MEKRSHRRIKGWLFAVAVAGTVLAAGCGSSSEELLEDEDGTLQAEQEKSTPFASCYGRIFDLQEVTEVYRDSYEETFSSNMAGGLETVKRIVNGLGACGYVAVDDENQVNMTHADQVIAFCGAADRQSADGMRDSSQQDKDGAELTMVEVTDTGGLVNYNLKAEAGDMDVSKTYYQYQNGRLEKKETCSFTADSWAYTEEGYLLFAGSYFSEDYYVLTLSDASEQAAFRVEPLDEACREQNRKYIRPVGYRKNSLFLTDWSGEDFGSLNFYDLFDCFYPLVYQQPVPYVMDENLGVGAVYRIPAELFEQVILAYIEIDRESLRSRTVYVPEDQTYEYKPRGFYEMEYPEIPYPEVVGCTQNPDGTITFQVNAVYPDGNTSRAFSHETVIRPLEDGSFRYVSNRMCASPASDGVKEARMWWHADRLTEEEWEKAYGESP